MRLPAPPLLGTLTGVEMEARPHMILLSCSPDMPRFRSSLIVTLPTLCNQEEHDTVQH